MLDQLKQRFQRRWFLVAATSGSSLYGAALSALGVIVTARLLGPEGRGTVSAAVTWILLFATFGSFSLGQVMLHEVSGKRPEEWLGVALGSIWTILSVVVLLSWSIGLVGWFLTDGGLFVGVPNTLMILAFLSLPSLLLVDFNRSLLAALGAIHFANFVLVAGATSNLLLILLLVGVINAGTGGAIIAFVVSNLVMSGIGVRYALRLRPSLKVDRQLIVRQLRGGTVLQMNAVGVFLSNQASLIILSHSQPIEEVGHVQLAVQFFSFLTLVPQAASTVGYALVAKQGPDAAWRDQRTLLVQMTVATIFLVVGAYVTIPIVVPLVAGEEFTPAVPLTQLLLPSLFGAMLSSVMASQWIGRGLFWQASILTLVIGTVSTICTAIAVPRIGTAGALVGMMVTYGISVVGNGGMALWVEQHTKWERRATTEVVK